MNWPRDRATSALLIIAMIGMTISAVLGFASMTPLWEIAWHAIYRPTEKPTDWDNVLYTNYYQGWITFAATVLGSIVAIASVIFAVAKSHDDRRARERQDERDRVALLSALIAETGIVLDDCLGILRVARNVRREVHGISSTTLSTTIFIGTMRHLPKGAPAIFSDYKLLGSLGSKIAREAFSLRAGRFHVDTMASAAITDWERNNETADKKRTLKDTRLLAGSTIDAIRLSRRLIKMIEHQLTLARA